MNRYSLFFTILVASSFGLHPTQAGSPRPAAGESQSSLADTAKQKKKLVLPVRPESLNEAANACIGEFLDKARSAPDQAVELQVLFVTVPHPTETHLAASFDRNVNALQDGLGEAGYLFDSSWIPWTPHEARGSFDDDEKEKDAQKREDKFPGILLFRRSDADKSSYTHGIVVFLVSEKPTQGIALPQLSTAMNILKENRIPFAGAIRILGPNYSGSLPSLISAVRLLHGPGGNPAAEVLIRSGGVSGGEDAKAAVKEIAQELPGTHIDFGSTRYDNAEWNQAAMRTLQWIGIEQKSVATLSEGESAYGRTISGADKAKKSPDKKPKTDCQSNPASSGCASAEPEVEPAETPGPWRLSFPRDISSLREGYEKQGIFDTGTQSQPWKRILNLKGDEQGEGDSVRSFGGGATVAAEEATLFGVSDFIRVHGVRAVIISATNEEDRYFLTQFLHVHNADVRVVLIGATRTFMRGSTAQFRGDMVVDDFPMFPRLHEWTSERGDRVAQIFGDSEAQGIYIAAIDLFEETPDAAQGSPKPGEPTQTSEQSHKWHSEYSAPIWDNRTPHDRRPPMYMAALGSNALWPVSEYIKKPTIEETPGAYRVEMPFTLFARDSSGKSGGNLPKREFPVGRSWKHLFWAALASTALYCFLFWIANPVSGTLLTSFDPSREWRFWLFKVTLPAAVAGGLFQVLATTVALPAVASSNAVHWWRITEEMTVLAPLLIALAAVMKAMFKCKLGQAINEPESASRDKKVSKRFITFLSMAASFLPALAFLVHLSLCGIFKDDPFAGQDASSILNVFREMHPESGLSLLPTALLFLLAILVWSSQAGNGASLFEAAPELPTFHDNPRISQGRAASIASFGLPLSFTKNTTWLWIVWVALAATIVGTHYFAHPFVEMTTIDSHEITCIVRGTAGAIAALMLLDVLQFFGLWNELQGLLRALDRESFKRSFVPIQDFKWRNLWSFTGISLQDRRAVIVTQIKCIRALAVPQNRPETDEQAEESKDPLNDTIAKYRNTDLSKITSDEYRGDLAKVYKTIAEAGTEAAILIQSPNSAEEKPKISASVEALQRVLACQCAGSGGRFSEEAEALARLPERIQTAERLLCLIYIGFIQTVVARLHTLLISIATVFSLVTLGIAIYPFVPFMPLLLAGVALMALIGWAFFKIFSEMDTDPILSRIVNGDDRKLQGNFYMKFAEAIALPLLALGSSLLPGGTGRLLELAQALLTQGQ